MTLDQTTTGTGAIVETTLGPVQGTQADGVHAFLGIPYAAPPFGDLRMRPPEPHEPWTEVLDATRYGATVPKSQYPPPTNQFLLDPEIDGEDCLNLNVWTSDPSAGVGMPVFVWIYGGGFTQGANSIPTYAGTKFARDGVVGVTINYRLGADGFLALGDGVANCALLDMAAALEWVRDNIAAFGGDPDQVTIAGESAGALAVYALLAMPRAEGLFSRAIAQSGGPISFPAATGRRVGEWLADKLGIEPTREAFAAVPIPELLAAQQALSTAARTGQLDPAVWGDEGPPPLPFAPIIDGDVLPDSIASLIAGGASSSIPLLAGSNTEEDRIFLAPTGILNSVDDAFLVSAAARQGLERRWRRRLPRRPARRVGGRPAGRDRHRRQIPPAGDPCGRGAVRRPGADVHVRVRVALARVRRDVRRLPRARDPVRVRQPREGRPPGRRQPAAGARRRDARRVGAVRRQRRSGLAGLRRRPPRGDDLRPARVGVVDDPRPAEREAWGS